VALGDAVRFRLHGAGVGVDVEGDRLRHAEYCLMLAN
jgi:hypothetical protein